ncbi:MAG: metallophosphoesterase family protein [Clostridia bacterium]
MDKIALIADIHGNLTALKAVLADIKSRGITRIYCLGDIAIKGISPNEVTNLIRENCDVVVRGNCDHLLAHNCVIPLQKWTIEHMSKENVEWLGSLPMYHEFYLSGHFVRIFHASPLSLKHIFNPLHSNAESADYKNFEILNPLDMFKNTEFLGKSENDPIPDIVGYAHIHSPNMFRFKNKTLFNTGSVGLPIEIDNDEDDLELSHFSTISSYIILEGNLNSKKLSSYSINLIRLPYNLKDEIDKLEKSDIPDKDILLKNLSKAMS